MGPGREGREHAPAPQDALARDVEMTPSLPSWADYFAALPRLGRRISVASPCVGIHGCGQSLLSMGVGADARNCYDLELAYSNYLNRHWRKLGQGVGDIVAELHLGRLVWGYHESGDPLPHQAHRFRGERPSLPPVVSIRK